MCFTQNFPYVLLITPWQGKLHQVTETCSKKAAAVLTLLKSWCERLCLEEQHYSRYSRDFSLMTVLRYGWMKCVACREMDKEVSCSDFLSGAHFTDLTSLLPHSARHYKILPSTFGNDNVTKPLKIKEYLLKEWLTISFP